MSSLDAGPSSSSFSSYNDKEKRQFEDGLRELIDCLPLETVEYAFAYGSGAVKQISEDRSEKMMDFIAVTRDALAFHQANVERNPRHYSALRFIGPTNLSVLQTNFGGHVYYNTLIRSADRRRLFKYGVIEVEDLRSDLLDWNWLYVSGRLHKPVVNIITPPADQSGLNLALLENRKCALHAALLQLPDTFSFEQLFQTIVGISYTGDFRMRFAEDRQKISKIVNGAMDQLKEVYVPLIKEDSRVAITSCGCQIDQDGSTVALYHRLNLLPSGVLNGLCKFYRRMDMRERDIEEVVFSMSHRHDVAERVREAIVGIVRPAVFRQTVMNGMSAGILKSVVYSTAKLLKMFRSIR